MQNQENCHENVWILSGTSDGPAIVNKLLKLNFVVFVSVVTYKASKSYPESQKLHIITGRLNTSNEVSNFIEKNKIDYVVDATHPFAQIISENLNLGCEKCKKPLLLFQRKIKTKKHENVKYISDLKGIKNVELKDKNILLAIGSRYLEETARYYLDSGANVFARVLPTSDSISKAFSSSIKNSNIAILEPTKNKVNLIEKKLCDFWEIDYVLCRDSGSYTQTNWETIITESNMKLFLLSRPKLKHINNLIFSDYDKLIAYLTKSN